MWPKTDLLELLGIDHPIIQAPMAGSTTPALVGAVSNAGGLGSLGCARQTPDGLRTLNADIRKATNRPFNLNFFAHEEPELDEAAAAEMRERLAPYYKELGIGEVPSATVPYGGFDDAILQVMLDLRPPVISFHFGLPDEAALTALKEAGIILIASATTVAEAKLLESSGMDAIIAQGYEAGGHRGTFAGPMETGTVSTFPLVPQVVDAVDVPVIAAGGIADGRGIAAALALGASGVQMGTAFLTCTEASVHPVWRDALVNGQAEDTMVTALSSGRPARLVRNRLYDELADLEHDAPPFPVHYSLVAPLRTAGGSQDTPDFQAMYAGQAMAMNRAMPAADLVETLVAETRDVLSKL